MKKYLLLFLMCVYASIGAWAATTVDIRTSGVTTTITITGDGTETVGFADGCEYLPGKAVNNTVVTGPLTEAVWTAIMGNKGGWNTQADSGQVIDLKGVTGLTTSELLSVGMFGNINGTNNTNYIILPTDSDVPTALQTTSNTTPSFDYWDNLKYFIIPQTDGSCKVVIVDLDGQNISDYTTSIISHLVLGTGIKKVEVLAITDDDQTPATIADKEAVEAAEPAKKTRKPRAKKEVAAEATAPAEKPARKPRAPRKKKVVPNFVIQNNAEDSITYASVVEKVQAAVTIQDVTSLDIYVKAEEGKAYYVVNGEAAGAVDLFLD